MENNIKRHTLLKSIILHLLPGLLVGGFYFAVAAFVKRKGYPSVMALISAVFLVFFSTLPILANSSNYPVWKKAVSIMGKNTQWISGKKIVQTEKLDSDGNVIEYCTVYITQTATDNGKVKNKVTKVTYNGKKLTDENRKKAEKLRDKNFSSKITSGNPLKDGLTDKPVKKLNKTKKFFNKKCYGFEFYKKVKKNKSLRGIAWVDKQSNAPLKIEYFPGKDAVGEITFSYYYNYKSDGTWYPEKSIMDVKLKVLFIKKYFRIKVQYKDYFIN